MRSARSNKVVQGRWAPRSLSPDDCRPKGQHALCAATARIVDPNRSLASDDFVELESSIYLAARGYNIALALSRGAPSRGDITAKLDKLMTACAGLKAALNDLDDAALHWLFAIDSGDKLGKPQWRLRGLPPPSTKRRLAIDQLIGAALYEPGKVAVSAPAEVVVANLRDRVIASLSSMAEDASGDLKTSVAAIDPADGRSQLQTGSIASLTLDTPKRQLVEHCLALYAHYRPRESPAATGTWNEQPAVRLIRKVYRLATGKGDETKGVGLKTLYEQNFRGFMSEPSWYAELLRWRRCGVAMGELYGAIGSAPSSEQRARVGAAKAAVNALLQSGKITHADVLDWKESMDLPRGMERLLSNLIA